MDRKVLLAAPAVVIIAILSVCLYRAHQEAQLHLRARLEALANHAHHASEGLRVISKDSTDIYERYRALFHLRSFRTEAAILAVWAEVDFNNIGQIGSAPDIVFGDYSEETYLALGGVLSGFEGRLTALAVRPWYVRRGEVEELLRQMNAAIEAAEAPGQRPVR